MEEGERERGGGRKPDGRRTSIVGWRIRRKMLRKAKWRKGGKEGGGKTFNEWRNSLKEEGGKEKLDGRIMA